MLKFGTKNALFWSFWSGNGKEYCHISNQHPKICRISKFSVKIRMAKFETRNALFSYFGTKTTFIIFSDFLTF